MFRNVTLCNVTGELALPFSLLPDVSIDSEVRPTDKNTMLGKQRKLAAVSHTTVTFYTRKVAQETLK